MAKLNSSSPFTEPGSRHPILQLLQLLTSPFLPRESNGKFTMTAACSVLG
jgi:hypothetical protein